MGQEASYLLEAGPHKLSLFLVLVVATSLSSSWSTSATSTAGTRTPPTLVMKLVSHLLSVASPHVHDEAVSIGWPTEFFFKSHCFEWGSAKATMTPPFVYEVTLPNISWCKWARRYICVKCCLAITLLSASCQEPKWARRYIHVWSIAFQLLCGALVVKSFKLRKRGRRLVPSGFATGDPWLLAGRGDV